MATVRFHAMRLDFQGLKTIMNNTLFTRLVFQPILEDVDKKKDEYILICYEEYSNNPQPQLSQLELIASNKKVFDAKKKVMFGNMPFKRATIQLFINDTPNAPYLYFLPTDYGDYAKYVVTTDPNNPAVPFVSYDLKPAPPAD